MTLPQGELKVASFELANELAPDDAAIQGRSLRQIAWRRLKQDRVAMAGGVGIVIILLVAILASQLLKLYGHAPAEYNSDLTSSDTSLPFGGWGGASSSHWLGVEPTNGRDILSRLIAGSRTSLLISLSATLLSLIFGLATGLIAGFYRGPTDSVLSRLMDVLLAFPTLLFSIALLSIFNSSPSFLGLSGQSLNFSVVIFVLGFFGFPYLGRIVRGQVLSLREKEFIDASRSLGASDWRIITREVMPNLVGPVLVWLTLTIPNYILGEAGLSFLGVGVQPPTSSWGQTLSDAGSWFQTDPTFLLWPGIVLFLTVLAFNLFGDGLRDALDPKSTR